MLVFYNTPFLSTSCDVRNASHLVACIVVICSCMRTVRCKQFMTANIADMLTSFIFFCDNIPVRIDKTYQLSGTVVGINMVVLLYQLSKYIIRVFCGSCNGCFVIVRKKLFHSFHGCSGAQCRQVPAFSSLTSFA